MKIGIASPADLTMLAPLLGGGGSGLPAGLGAAGISNLVASLLGRGDEVSLYTLDYSVTEIQRFSGNGLQILVGPYRRRHRMRDLMAGEREAIQRMIEGDRPDVVNAHWSYEFALGALASGRPTLVTCHDWAPEILWRMPSAYRFGRLLMSRRVMAQAQYFSADAPGVAHKVAIFTKRPCPVTPLGLPEGLFASQPRLRPAGPPVLLAANNGFSALKNVRNLLRAFALLRGTSPQARLELTGIDYQPGGPAQCWAEKKGLAAGVTFVGPLAYQDLLARMAQVSLFTHLSLSESLGMVVIEAMAQGTPVVFHAQAEGPFWVTEQGRGGLAVDGRAPGQVALAISGLLGDAAGWNRLSEVGLGMVRKRFGAGAQAQDVRKLLGEIANGVQQ